LHERRPRQADLRRALSTAYDALFHGLAETAADRLVGVTPQVRRSLAWSRVHRDLDHNNAKKPASDWKIPMFPPIYCSSPPHFQTSRNYAIKPTTTRMCASSVCPNPISLTS
jgi:hypothetical protein